MRMWGQDSRCSLAECGSFSRSESDLKFMRQKSRSWLMTKRLTTRLGCSAWWAVKKNLSFLNKLCPLNFSNTVKSRCLSATLRPLEQMRSYSISLLA